MKKLAVALLIFIYSFSAIYAAELPDLGSRAAYELPASKERELGLEFMQAVVKRSSLITDSIVNNYIRQLGARIYAHAQAENDPIKPQIFIVNSKVVNAFTGPGGYIGINSGLVLMTRTESELAAVTAHEMAHMTRHHIARMLAQANSQMLPTMGALLAAILVGVASGGAAGAGAMSSVLAGSMQNGINFIRLHEYEADRIGIRTMQLAGFDPHAMPEFFARLQQHTSDFSNILPEYLRTHPYAQSRIADAENRLANYPRRIIPSSLDYYIVRARLLMLTVNDNPYVLKTFSAQMNEKNNLLSAAAGKYGYALALAKIHQYARAMTIMMELMQQYPNELIYPMGLAEIKLLQRKNSEALALLTAQYNKYSSSYPLLLEYSNVLLATGQADKARQIMEKNKLRYQNDIPFNELLARAQGVSGHLAAAYQTRAKIFALEGRNSAARLQLQQALSQPNLNSLQRMKIQQELRQYPAN